MKTLKYILLIILIYLLLPADIYSQSITWQKTFKRSNSWTDVTGNDICELNDGNFLVISTIGYPNGSLIFRLNKYGNLLDSVFIPGYEGYCCAPTLDNGCIMMGTNMLSGDKIYALKLNSLGQIVWTKSYANSPASMTKKVIRTSDNKFIGCGNYNYSNSAHAIKIDENGNLIWLKIFSGGYSTIYNSVCESNNLGYMFSGVFCESELSDLYGTILQLDTAGNLIWEKRYRNLINIVVNRLNNAYLLGFDYTDTITYIKSSGFLKIDNIGNKLKQVFFPNILSLNPFHMDNKVISDNKYLFIDYFAHDTGSLYANVLISDSSGNILQSKLFNDVTYTYFTNGYLLNNNDLVFVGASNHIHPQWSNLFVARTDSNLYAPPVSVKNISTEVPISYSLSQNYPNPFNPITKIKFSVPQVRHLFGGSSQRVLGGDLVQLKVYDVMGREVQTLVNESLKPGTYEVSFDGLALTSGVYFYKLQCGNFVQTKRMVLIK